jgi:hypothetical protein
MKRIALVLLVAALGAAAAPARAELRYETADWTFVAPEELGTQADLELNARQVQLCTDELEKLLGHRPTHVAKFTMQWLPGAANAAGATSTGVLNFYLPGRRLVDPVTRSFRESIVAQGLCFGPHEATHVMTWESFRLGWASEGFATFTDRLYAVNWRCCGAAPATQGCDEAGYSVGSERLPYADLSPFGIDTRSYHTAACFWWEIHRIGGFPAVRALLASMRARPPTTTGELVVQHAHVVAGVDLRPALGRYGFDAAELVAPPPPAGPRICTRLGTGANDLLTGGAGSDVLCGLGGADRLVPGGGADVVRAGPGNDTLQVRDARPDTVACGPGRDTVRADRRDRVARDCEVVRR